MSCDYPIICKYWHVKCTAHDNLFAQKSTISPCEQHQNNIDKQAEIDYINAVKNGDFDNAEVVRTSPFTNFGK